MSHEVAEVQSFADDAERMRVEREFLLSRHTAAVRLIEDARPLPSTARPTMDAAAVRHAFDAFPPRTTRREFSSRTLDNAIASSGCLLVEGLIDPAVTIELAQGIDETFAAFDAWASARDQVEFEFGSWFRPLKLGEGAVHATRPWLRAGGGIFLADSPRLFRRWLELIRSSGLYDVVAAYFGEPPVGSLDKGTLRRVRSGDGIEWHQDGAFLGIDSGAINVWLALSETSQAPGLELVPRRFRHTVDTGTRGARYDWSVGDALVEELARETPLARPRFAPGDALLFDGLLLHRTAVDAVPLPGTRYAIETWFFRPSRFPDHQKVPLAL